MNMIKLSKVITDEQKAEEFLREVEIHPYCRNKHFGKVRRNFYKCYCCKREWSVRKGSVLERMKIPFNKFVLALKLFELEISVLKACKELEFSYNIVRSKRFANGKVYINGIEGFWSYAKGQLLKFHGLLPKTFPYYLKALEFRYNNRNESLFDKIVEAVRGGVN